MTISLVGLTLHVAIDGSVKYIAATGRGGYSFHLPSSFSCFSGLGAEQVAARRSEASICMWSWKYRPRGGGGLRRLDEVDGPTRRQWGEEDVFSAPDTRRRRSLEYHSPRAE